MRQKITAAINIVSRDYARQFSGYYGAVGYFWDEQFYEMLIATPQHAASAISTYRLGAREYFQRQVEA